ncbi:hypothetical protein R5W24_001236 [Gemmata sp. JC717]|uniref:Uncharacterized protein n=1 Tax=Gemmata algarum TaxID=2975278 RepID=A0ABU5ETL0_9BACT|nr:hypothetical protein [Gemmata algarum]MDY3552156.1 hypothetical protein [Gemmata algarum]MDY3558308.1 hypothetical protein [Gemmata algarum]
MNAVSKLAGGPSRRASLGAVLVLLVAPLGAAVALNPWTGASAAPAVAPADAFGLNVTEPADKANAPVAPVAMSKADAERAVSEWNPTGGGKGGGGSPKG